MIYNYLYFNIYIYLSQLYFIYPPKFAKNNGIPYFEVSAKLGKGIDEGFSFISNEIYDKIMENKKDNKEDNKEDNNEIINKKDNIINKKKNNDCIINKKKK